MPTIRLIRVAMIAAGLLLSSQAGAQTLAQGGSAMDAAIVANAVLGVTEPMMNGIGGDLFLIYWDAKSGKLYGLNSSGWAPRRQTIGFLAQRGITTVTGIPSKRPCHARPNA